MSAVDYTVDGQTYEGYFLAPEGKTNLPVIAIAHAWAGLGENEIQKAGRVVNELGYAAAQQVAQAQKLRGLVSQQVTMMGTWYQAEQAAKDLAQNRREEFFNSTTPSTSGGQTMEPRW